MLSMESTYVRMLISKVCGILFDNQALDLILYIKPYKYISVYYADTNNMVLQVYPVNFHAINQNMHIYDLGIPQQQFQYSFY